MNLIKISDLLNLYLIFLDLAFITVVSWFIIGVDGLAKRETRVAIGMVIYVFGHGMARTWNYIQPTTSKSNIVLFVGLSFTTIGLSIIWGQMARVLGNWIWAALILLSAAVAFGITWMQ